MDEDILQLYMFNQIIKVSTKSLCEVCSESRFDLLRDRVETILETPEDTYGSLKPSLGFGQSFSLNQEELSKLGSGSENVNDLLKAAAFVRHSDGMVNYFCPAMLKPGKYIILSATLNKTMYELYFKNMDVIYYEQPPVAYWRTNTKARTQNPYRQCTAESSAPPSGSRTKSTASLPWS